MPNTFRTEYACTKIEKRTKLDHVDGNHIHHGTEGDLPGMKWSEPCRCTAPTPYALVLDVWDSLHLFPRAGYQGVDPDLLEWDESDGVITFSRLEDEDGNAPSPAMLPLYRTGLLYLYRATYTLYVEARDYRCRPLNDRDIDLLNRKYLNPSDGSESSVEDKTHELKLLPKKG